MSAREDLASKIVERKESPSQILASFMNSFKQLGENEGTNRLAARKQSQSLGPYLLNVMKVCMAEISKNCSIEWVECYVQVLGKGTEMLSKISHHVFEKPIEYYKFSFATVAKLSEKGKWQASLDICQRLLKEISETDLDKEIRLLKIQLLITSSNSLLQLPITNIKTLEMVYDNLALKAKNTLYSLNSDSLTPKEHTTLNSIYHNLLKLLYNSGRLLDIKAAGDLSLHKQAMMIRTQGLEFFSKTRPLNKQDFFSFANSSVVTAYKVFSSSSKEYMHDVIDNIHALLQFISLKDYSLISDPNARNIIEVLIFFCCKLELYEVAKDTIQLLTESAEPKDLKSTLQHIKYYLDILRYSLQGNITSVMEVELVMDYLSFLFHENTATSIDSNQVSEIEEWTQKVRKNIEALIVYLANSNSQTGIKNEPRVGVENIVIIMEILSYYPKILKLIETLNGTHNADLEIYNYISGLSFTILYAHTKQEKCSASGLMHFKKLISISGSKYIEKMHNICLSLLHIGENDFGIKLLNIILESLQYSTESITLSSISLFELAWKYCSEAKNFFVHNCSLIQNYIISQVQLAKDSPNSCCLLLKALDIYHRLHQGYVSACISKGVDLSSLSTVSHLISHAIFQSIPYSTIDIELFFERELTNLSKSLLISIKNDSMSAVNYNIEMIQQLVYVVISEVFTPDSGQYSDWVIKYLEIISTAEKYFAQEWLLENYMPQSGMNLAMKVQHMIGVVSSTSSNMTLDTLKIHVYLEKMSEFEHEATDWPSLSYLQNSVNIAQHIKHILQDLAQILKVKNYELFGKYEKVICKDSCNLSEKQLKSMIKNCISIANFTYAFQMYAYESRALELLLHMLKKMPNDLFKGIRKALVKHRLILSLWHQGYSQAAASIYSKASKYSIVFDDESSFNTLLSNIWLLIYRAELAMEQGKSYESMSLCNEANKILPDGKGCNMKRVYLARSRCLYILSKVHYHSGNILTSYEMLKEARVLINELSLSTISLQNFSVLSKISEDYSSFIRENLITDEKNGMHDCVFYPYSAVNLQAHSLDMLYLMSDLMKYRGLVTTSNYCLNQGIKATLLLGFLSYFVQFKSALASNMIDTYTDPELVHDNITTDSKSCPNLSDFLIHMGTNLLPFLANSSRRESSIDTVHNLDERILNCKDIEHICEYLNPVSVMNSLILMGDIKLNCNYTSISSEALQFNYYKLAKAYLMPELQSMEYKRIRSALYSKLGNLASIHNKDPKNYILQAIRSLGCCEKFHNMFLSSSRCCSDYEINSVNIPRLCDSLIELSDILLTKLEHKTAYSILSQISNISGAISPYSKGRISHLLAKNKELNSWERSFHIFSSIGVSYTRQLEFKTKTLFPPMHDLSEFMSFTKQLPYSILGISLSDIHYRDSLLISRIDPGSNPINLILNDGCDCNSYNRSLRDLLSEFSYIMRETASTTSDTKVIKRSSSSWWSRRERLDEMLNNWLNEVSENYLGAFSAVLCGSDRNLNDMERVLKEIGGNRKCTKCGQEWNEDSLRMIISAVLHEKISQERFKMCLTAIGVTKNIENILKKIKSIKKPSTIDYPPLVLILDGLLLHLPWESLPIFKSVPLTRLPSLSFLSSRRSPPSINPSNTFFILNPSKDLENTQQTFHPFLTSRNFSGLDQEAPTESSFSSALEQRDLLLYFGHSSGEQYLKGDRVKELHIKAVAMLMGCSSGLLKQQGSFDPQGISVQYMLGGCPALVANLWDVTDKDIDRLSIDFLKRFIDNSEPLPSALQNARKACKLKSLIGAAPVCYGVPVYCSKEN